MIELLLSVPGWAWGLVIVAIYGAALAISWRGYNNGRLDGLHEADQRNRDQQLHDFQRGQFDGVRRAAEWLRNHDQKALAQAMPSGLLQDHSNDQTLN